MFAKLDVMALPYGECVRYFNTGGPCLPGKHYMLPAEARLPEARSLIDRCRTTSSGSARSPTTGSYRIILGPARDEAIARLRLLLSPRIR